MFSVPFASLRPTADSAAVSDVTVLLRDVAGDAAQTAATRINPSEEKLSQIDAPAADNTWHDVPSATELKNKANQVIDKNKPFNKKEAQDAASNAAGTGQDASATGSKSETAQAAATTGKNDLVNKAGANVPEETKQKGREAAEKARQQARDYLGKKVPKERREQTIWRLKKMVVEIQGHDDCECLAPQPLVTQADPFFADQQAIETLLSLAEQYGGHGKTVGSQSVGSVQGAHTDDSLKGMEANLKVCHRLSRRQQIHADELQDPHRALRQLYVVG